MTAKDLLVHSCLGLSLDAVKSLGRRLLRSVTIKVTRRERARWTTLTLQTGTCNHLKPSLAEGDQPRWQRWLVTKRKRRSVGVDVIRHWLSQPCHWVHHFNQIKTKSRFAYHRMNIISGLCHVEWIFLLPFRVSSFLLDRNLLRASRSLRQA